MSPRTARIKLFRITKPLSNPSRLVFLRRIVGAGVKVGTVCGGGEERRKGCNRLMNGATKFVRLLDPFTVSLEVTPPPLNQLDLAQGRPGAYLGFILADPQVWKILRKLPYTILCKYFTITITCRLVCLITQPSLIITDLRASPHPVMSSESRAECTSQPHFMASFAPRWTLALFRILETKLLQRC